MRNWVAAGAALFLSVGFVHSSEAKLSAAKDRLVTLDGSQSVNSFIGMNDPRVVALQFLKQNAQKLGLRSDGADLQFESVTRTAVGYHVRFQQVQNGMAVYAGNIVVTLNRGLQVVTFVNSYKAIANTEAVLAPKLKGVEAVKGSYQFLKLNSSPRYQQVLPMLLVKNGQTKTIYRVRISAPVDRKYSWEILTDAETNKVLFAKDIAMNEKVVGAVFDPNPTIRTGKAYGSIDGFKDDNNADSAFFTSMLTEVEIPGLTSSNGVYELKGPYAQIVDSESPTNPDCRFTTADFRMTRSKPCFDMVNTYYFLDKSLRYVNEKLGIQAMPFQYQGGIKADPHGLDGADNSHYDPRSGELAFGEGGVDDAQDHDVILHELGHGIHDWVTHGHLSQVEGLSEGCGDYWALSYGRQFMKPDNVAYQWTFSFDGHNEFWPGRVTNVSGTYPNAASGEVHTAGQLWATANMLIWNAIGKEKADKIFWSGLAMLNESSNQQDAAEAVTKAAQQIYPADSTTVAQIFRSKGYNIK